ncbi:conserved hypothetical protein [Aspergillus terreus NIH2624]|uniref:Cytochrome b-c1 complex subunit 8 n=1 Tax=Aspergillus terreus (strain NIH 2624 / FGSC A1156) TaxID=341663 RepID=Q0CS79_ASPTN|nr:uncharacterized protein ATEG_03455 [Aspergillus terreus NIH2624]EAU36729.1 conserved hypothetical protein [Aspergillus terreus NIH2624]
MGGNLNDPKNGYWLGVPGAFVRASPQRVVTYVRSPNRLRPLAGCLHAAIFNVARRCRQQALYVVPPFIVAYVALLWADERQYSYAGDIVDF